MMYEVKMVVNHVRGQQFEGFLSSAPIDTQETANTLRDEMQFNVSKLNYVVVFNRYAAEYLNGERVLSTEILIQKSILDDSVITFYVLETA